MDVEIVSPDVHLQQDDTKISHIVKAIGSLLNTIFEYKFTKANHILFEDIIILHPLNNGSINIREVPLNIKFNQSFVIRSTKESPKAKC